MNCEEIQNVIEQDLISNGFERVDNSLVKVNIRQQQIIINGQQSVQEQKQETKFVYLGEGSIDDTPTVGYALYINNHNVTDLWCTNLDDFNYLLKTL